MLEIEIVDIEQIEGGISVYARAWRDGEQLGFGKDGTVDIERFRIFNPPILVPDDNGDIVRQTRELDGRSYIVRYREDPEEALLQVLNNIISQVGKPGKTIIAGKVGNTTSTFYPDANPESTSVDGDLSVIQSTWNAAHDATSGTADDSGNDILSRSAKTGSGTHNIWRAVLLFDTTTLPDTDNIDSATLDLFVFEVKNEAGADGYSYQAVVSSNPASNVALASGDYDAVGDAVDNPTKGSADIANNTFSTGVYNSISLNATGLSWISTTGVTKLGVRDGHDIEDNVGGLTGNGIESHIWFYAADQTGTANDPKLVVEHAAGGSPTVYNALAMCNF